MGTFDRQIATALRLIKKNGQLVQWRQIPDSETPSDTPWNPVSPQPIDNNVYICFLPIDRENKEFISALRGTEVASGSVQGLMAAVSFMPTGRDVVVRDGKILKIESIDILAPNGQIILYTINFKD